MEIIRTLVSVATLISIYFAYKSYKASNLKKEDEDKVASDKEIFAQALNSLKWGFEVLSEGGAEKAPKASRLNWLTSARHITRYVELKKLIQTKTYRLICDENEEYWRHKFYVLLDRQELRCSAYFTSDPSDDWPENIEITSAMVINNFANWQDETVDPIDVVDREELIKCGKPFSGMCGQGLRKYYLRFEEIKSQRGLSAQQEPSAQLTGEDEKLL
ncbi:hypothetical protein [Pseudoalteromonas luteoviolacea]|uniref:Uncharacterized protein n=1 Tax=Pseudoalteromonas luteoviolacea S4054 TaxID=1129367 RepID=A0A0F6AAD4_9GAMM|nr:hypothetical protein [Pseudoalteromonas luteoviolacea]AOT07847.1 hypothetical protein S4054249_08330 [Pseudoalteromonas luteoviolacea]AOT12763.1 hypothetical protein S40542_08330 [Pseudoalteromonas luteoviolacea]AOT17676.1 hypothetical protein S4054_08325 [Pseudoalteromonas luteoviolacea]KKE82339.1 hypothetical protein N479_19050 [Pseudoalteromonas luteoviolacea S4054]KZN78991.1 hypothetical protein N481_00680 [Pseudoalteromonas luteoviolacea S4047-1]